MPAERYNDSDPFFSHNIDNVSQAQISDMVQRINYSIDHLISNIMDDVQKFELSYHSSPSPQKHILPQPDSDIKLIQKLLESESWHRRSKQTKDLVVESVVHNLITSMLHKHFFEGGHFFGVGSKTLREHLETMLSKLVAGGKFYLLIKKIFFDLCLH
jgi:hypothetical protein